MHAVNGQCLAQACLQVAEVVLSIYHLALVCRLQSLHLRHPVFQVPSTETSSASNTSAASESGCATSSEPSPNGQQGRARISQAEAGLTLDSSAPAEAVQFQAEVISSIDKVRLSDHKPPCPLSLQPELLPLLRLNIWTVYLYAMYGPSSSDPLDFNDQDAAVILDKAQHLQWLQVAATEWDECAKGSGEVNPFLLHAFLLALEESGSAVSDHLLTPKPPLFMRVQHRQSHAQLQPCRLQSLIRAQPHLPYR